LTVCSIYFLFHLLLVVSFVLIFTSKEDRVNEDGKSNVTFYQTKLSRSFSSKIVTLEGNHYLHWTRYKEMSAHVNDFTKTFAGGVH